MRTFAPSLDEYRAAKIIIDQFGEKAEQRALRHVNHLFDAGDHEGVARWMNVLAAVQELRRTTPAESTLHEHPDERIGLSDEALTTAAGRARTDCAEMARVI